MIVLYGNHCPKCNILEKKLIQADMDFEYCTDTETMQAKGFDFLPVLEVDGRQMGYKEAIDWANKR